MTEQSGDENRRREMKEFRNKANMLASIHSKLSDSYRKRYTILNSILLFISVVLVGLTFVSEQFVQSTVGVAPDLLRWLLGITSILNFSGILLLSQWKWQERATEHREAVRFYFQIVNRIRQWLESDVDITEDIIDEIRTDYSKTQSLPKIPDSEFLPLKQWHLQKIAVSRELDKHPFESIRSIKKRLTKSSVQPNN